MKPLLSYRSRLRLKRIALTLLCILLAAIVVVVGIVIYLERYVVYTDTVHICLSCMTRSQQTQLFWIPALIFR